MPRTVVVLPYINQLVPDFVVKSIPAPPPPVLPVSPYPVPPFFPEPPFIPQFDTPMTYGSTPPSDPEYGWLWVNTSNNGLYAYVEPGVWQQIGTNW